MTLKAHSKNRMVGITLYVNIKQRHSPSLSTYRSASLRDDVRYDGFNHWPQANEGGKQISCRECGGKSTRICGKCRVGLHDLCFEKFHTRP